ncbi:MAG: hypothetical protein V3U21_04475 [Thermodesulfobacteriota bacterium]
MADNNETSNEEQQPQESGAADLMTSVTMAFNMGVAANQSMGKTKSVAEIAPELGQQIYTNLANAYGGKYEEEYLAANTEYFLQIALLGFVIPSVCAFEEGFKDTLFALIEAKAHKMNPDKGSPIDTPPDTNIIV